MRPKRQRIGAETETLELGAKRVMQIEQVSRAIACGSNDDLGFDPVLAACEVNFESCATPPCAHRA